MRGSFADGLKLIPVIEKNLEEYALYVDPHRILVFNYKIAMLYFGAGQYEKAIDYLLPYVTEGKQWEYQQINPYKVYDFYRLLLIAADKFKDASYRTAAEKIKDSNKNIFVKLFFE